MHKWVLPALLLIVAFASPAFSQEGGPPHPVWGIGVRYTPSMLMSVVYPRVDPTLGSAAVLEYWLNPTLALELGGWLSSYRDTWNENNTTLWSAGLRYALTQGQPLDLYLAGRGISLQFESNNPPYVKEPLTDAVDIMPPLPRYESISSTLALQACGGLRWHWSSEVALHWEISLIYAQTVSTNRHPSPEPTPPPDQPQPLQMVTETFASSQMDFLLTVGIFYLFF